MSWKNHTNATSSTHWHVEFNLHYNWSVLYKEILIPSLKMSIKCHPKRKKNDGQIACGSFYLWCPFERDMQILTRSTHPRPFQTLTDRDLLFAAIFSNGPQFERYWWTLYYGPLLLWSSHQIISTLRSQGYQGQYMHNSICMEMEGGTDYNQQTSNRWTTKPKHHVVVLFLQLMIF